MSMQYTAIFHDCENGAEFFGEKKELHFYYFCSKHRSERVHVRTASRSNEYPQSMFKSSGGYNVYPQSMF